MGRTEKVDLHLRVNVKLKKILTEQSESSGKTLNSFCCEVLSNANLVRATILKANAEKASLKLFASMSHNINQIAYHCNSSGQSVTEEQLLFVLAKAESMKQEIIDEIRRKGVVIRGNF